MNDNDFKFLFLILGFISFILFLGALVVIFAPPEAAKAFLGVR